MVTVTYYISIVKTQEIIYTNCAGCIDLVISEFSTSSTVDIQL